MNGHLKKITLGLLLASSASLMAMNAFATEGYFTHGSGARNKAMGGAGVADGRDATSAIVNPAGMVGNGTEATISLSLFSPKRKFNGSGAPSFTPNGSFESSEKLFAIPNAAYIHAIDDTSSWGIGLAANGGMNSNYRDVANPVCGSRPFPATSGVFCGGTTGVNLSQALISVSYAKQFGNFKVGVSPIFAFQMFEATGLQVFTFPSAPGFPPPTSDPANFTNRGTDKSTGFGGKIGFEWSATEQIRFGGTYQTKIDMNEFDKYAGLFADGGDFDIPSNYQLGMSADLTPSVTVSVDYRHIKYSDAGSVNNPQIVIDPANGFPKQFGTAGGPGFGWEDINVIKFGAEWRMSDQLSLRAGYAHNDQPIQSENVTLNILAPGVVTSHFTGGGEYKLNDQHSFEFGIMYAPPDTVRGIEVTTAANPNHFIDIKMNQVEATVGWKMKFGK